MATIDPRAAKRPNETYAEWTRRLRASGIAKPSWSGDRLSGGEVFRPTPQRQNETNGAYMLRQPFDAIGARLGQVGTKILEPSTYGFGPEGVFTAASRDLGIATREAGKAFDWAVDRPKDVQRRRQAAAAAPKSQARPIAASSVFPNSYRDPLYGQLEQRIAAETGVPLGVLSGIRTLGEKSNNDQVSSAGARSPYQFIPETRQAIKKKYGFDVLANPENAVRGAALLLKEGAQRNGGDFGLAVREYHGGPNRANWGPVNSAYFQRVMGSNGQALDVPTQVGVPNFVNPFDPSYGQAALAEVDRATGEMLKPQTATLERGVAPELPKPAETVKTDFSEVDAALERLRPEEMLEADKRKMQRQGLLKGLSQALMTLPENAGLGKVLAAIGGGMLGGRVAADDEIRQRMDRHDERMAQFNVAVLRNESAKAEIIAREANVDVQQMNQYARDKYIAAYQRWSQDNDIDVTADAIITKRPDANGNLVVTRTPHAGAIRGAGALQRAQILQGMGGQANSGNAQVASAVNGFLGTQAAATNNFIASAAASQFAAAAGGDPEADPAAAASLVAATMADHAVRYGRVGEVIGTTAYTGLRAAVNGRMTQAGFPDPSNPKNASLIAMRPNYDKEYRERFDEMLTEEVTRLALLNPQDTELQQRLLSAGGGGVVIEQANARRTQRTSTRVDSRGRRTTTTSNSTSEGGD